MSDRPSEPDSNLDLVWDRLDIGSCCTWGEQDAREGGCRQPASQPASQREREREREGEGPVLAGHGGHSYRGLRGLSRSGCWKCVDGGTWLCGLVCDVCDGRWLGKEVEKLCGGR